MDASNTPLFQPGTAQATAAEGGFAPDVATLRERQQRANTLREAAEQLLAACDLPDVLPGAENRDPERMRRFASRLLRRADDILAGGPISARREP